MKLSLVQQQIIWGNKTQNLATFAQEAHALYGNTDIVVLPEMFSTGFCVSRPELAETPDGETMKEVKRWASEGNFSVVGSFMATDGKKFYNRAFFCQPNGTISFADKHHLFIGDEQKYFTSGKNILDVTFRNVKFRVLVCFDVRFPVWSRNMNGNDYDVLIYVANWPQDRIETWDILLKARAIENQAYVCGVNVVGKDNYNIYHCGHSTLLDTRGRTTITFTENELATKTGEIDIEKQNQIRKRLPFGAVNDQFSISK